MFSRQPDEREAPGSKKRARQGVLLADEMARAPVVSGIILQAQYAKCAVVAQPCRQVSVSEPAQQALWAVPDHHRISRGSEEKNNADK